MSHEAPSRLTPVQVLGLVMWRGGLMLVASYGLFRVARFVLTYTDLPAQLQIGFGLAIAGAVMVLLSLVLERMQDLDEERSVHE